MAKDDTRKGSMSIVLTGSVVQCYRNLERTGLQDPGERLTDYLCAISRWLKQPEIDHVLYCDAGPFLIPEEIFDNKKLESMRIDLRSVAYQLGKGPAESKTLEHVMNSSTRLRENFFKCTGRLFVKNFTEIVRKINFDAKLMAISMNQDYRWADTRFFWLDRTHYRNVIHPNTDLCDDYQKCHIERLYHYFLWQYQDLPPPVVVGRFGHTGELYDEDYSPEEKENARNLINRHGLLRGKYHAL